jgi:hypothetical protein
VKTGILGQMPVLMRHQQEARIAFGITIVIKADRIGTV